MGCTALVLQNKELRDELVCTRNWVQRILMVKFLTSPAAEDLHAQVEGVSELHRDDAQVASSDQPPEPAGYRGPAHHPYLKHLHHNQEDTST